MTPPASLRTGDAAPDTLEQIVRDGLLARQRANGDFYAILSDGAEHALAELARRAASAVPETPAPTPALPEVEDLSDDEVPFTEAIMAFERAVIDVSSTPTQNRQQVYREAKKRVLLAARELRRAVPSQDTETRNAP